MTALWLILLVFIYCLRKKAGFIKQLGKTFFLFITFLLAVIFSWTFPVRIKKNIDLMLFDDQSHTYYSWDGFYSPGYSIKWHKRNGYDAFFITDHWNMDARNSSVFKVDSSPVIRNVGFGLEVAQSGNYFIINEELKTPEALDRLIFEGKAISLFRWESKNLKEIEDIEFYGYEIYNQGHPQLDFMKRMEMLNEGRNNKTKLFAGTDWHGYLSFSWAWSVVEFLPGRNIKKLSGGNNFFELDKFVFSKDWDPQVKSTKVVLYGKTIIHKLKPSLLEPWRSIFIYFSGLDIIGVLSWLFWIYISIYLKKNKLLKSLCEIIIIAWFVRLFCLGIYFRTNYLQVMGRNQVLNDTSSLLLIIPSIYFFYCLSLVLNKFMSDRTGATHTGKGNFNTDAEN